MQFETEQEACAYAQEQANLTKKSWRVYTRGHAHADTGWETGMLTTQAKLGYKSTRTIEPQTREGAALALDGYTMTYHTVDAGSYKEPSKFSVTIKRNGLAFSTEYSKGAAHRRWTEKAKMLGQWQGQFPKQPKQGERVPQLGRVSLWMESSLIDCTEPIPPELGEVVYALQMDASYVRHGQAFCEFASDLGGDSDSIKCKALFDACRDTWASLVRLGADWDALDRLFEGY